jgi:hypothetical protein
MRRVVRTVALGLAVAMVASVPVRAAAAQQPHRQGAPQPTLTERIDQGIDQVRAELFWDAETARQWVADHITFEPYDGVLKGARGAYLTRRANSADQALLLVTLLNDAALTFRFAACDLTATADPVAPTELPDDQLATIAAELTTDLTDSELKDAILAVPGLRATQRTESARAADELALALQSAPIRAQSTSQASATQHVWLQVARGGTWADLDPSTADGAAPCPAAETWDALPQRMEHRIVVRLMVEQRVGASAVESEALRVELPMGEVATARIAFAFAEPAGLLEPAPEAVGALVGYTPVLVVDNQVTSGTPLYLPRPRGAGGTFGDEINDIGEDILGSPDPGTLATEDAPYTAAWLQLELTSPTGPTVAVRSDVFDRVGVVARASGSANSAPVAPLTEIGGEYGALSALWQIGLLTGEVAAPEAAADPSLDITAFDGISGQLDGLLRTFPSVRRDLGGEPVVGPSVVLAGLEPSISATGAQGVRLVFDAVHVPGTTGADRLSAARDAQAVLGAEALLTAFVGLDEDDVEDAGGVFRLTRDAGSPLVLLQPGDVPLIERASAAALARMGQRLDAGLSLLTPSVAPTADGTTRTAWWTVDPSTGVVRDEHESGRHSQTVEYSGTTERSLTMGERFRRIACKITGPVVIAASLVFVATGGQIGGDVLKNVAKTAQLTEERRRQGEEARKIACADNRF